MPNKGNTDSLESICAITFDLDDTLWDIWPIIDRAEQRLHDWLALHYPRIPRVFSPLEIRELSFQVAERHPRLAHDRTWLRKEALRLASIQADYEEFHVESAYEIFFAARNEVVFFEEVLPVLERLAQRYVIGALSNGNADIDRVGLGHVFDFALTAIDVGAAKPAPAMFEAAIGYLGVAPGRIVHVGDDPENDVIGAARAGLRTVWVNRPGKDWPGGEPADAEIRTLEELEILLARWDE
jgi:putative hydrolase of the HAD superfamily